MEATSTLTEAELAAQLTWTRRLALALVHQPDEAEDLAQETLIAAWQQRPDTSRHLGPWLVTVARNLLRSRVRGDRRRSRREVEAESRSPAEVPSPEQSLAALEAQRRLLTLVSELDAPYRQVLMLRFYEDNSAADIARALGIPAGTVRWRLKTALDLLRARMDAAHGNERAAWVGLLLPGLAPASPGAGPSIRPSPEAAPGRGIAAWGSVVLLGAAAITAALLATRGGSRVESAAKRPASAWVLPVARPPVLVPAVTAAGAVGPGLRVQVQDVTGGAIPGAAVRTAGGQALGHTDSQGLLALDPDVAQLGPFVRVMASADGYAEGAALSSVPGVAVVRLLPQSLVMGRVVARATGQPVAGVTVWCQGQTASSGADGRFELRDVPPGRHTLLAYGDGWFGRGARPFSLGPADTARDLLVEVDRAFSVSGRVSMNGAAAPGLTVQIAGGVSPEASGTDGEGRYRVVGLPPGSYRVEVRGADTFGTFRDLPLTVEARDATLDIDLGRRERVMFEALDEQGRPVTGLGVRAEQTHQEVQMARTCHTDALGRCALAGLIPTEVHYAARDTAERALALPTDGRPIRMAFGRFGTVHGRLRRPDGRPVGPRYITANRRDGGGFASAHSDDAGGFELKHLPEGLYELEVYLQNGICMHTPREARAQVAVGAGDDATIELEVASGSAVLTGVVVDESGRAVPDALVSYDHHEPHLARNDAFTHGLDLTVTDAKGAFRFEHVLPHYRYRLQAHTRDGAVARVEPVSAGTSGVRLPLERLADLTVGVRGFSATDLDIEIVRDGRVQLFRFGSGGRGDYRFDNLRPGPITVRAKSEGRTAEAGVLLHPGEQARLRLEAPVP